MGRAAEKAMDTEKLRSQLNEALQAHDSIEKQAAELGESFKRDTAALGEALRAAKAEQERLKADLEKRVESSSLSEKQLQAARSELASAQEELQQLKSNEGTINTAGGTQESGIDATEAESLAATAAAEAREAAAKEAAVAREAADKELEAVRQQFEGEVTELKAKLAAARQANNEADTLKDEIQALRGKLQDATSAAAEAKIDADHAISDLQHQVEALQSSWNEDKD